MAGSHEPPRTVPDPIKVFLCDDAPALRDLLRAFLELEGDIAIAGEAGDGEGLAGAVRDAAADVVLLDLTMPRVDGLEALAELRAHDPGLGVVVLSGFDRERMAEQALALGADHYLEKAAGLEQVRAAVRAVAAGRRRGALERHDDLVQGLTAIHWALEAGAYEQARAATQATLAQAQTLIGDLLVDQPGALRRDAAATPPQRP